MIYRGPGFLTACNFLLFPPPSPVRKLDRAHTGKLRKKYILLTKEWGGQGTKSYDGEKAWSSINQSILPALYIPLSLQVHEVWQRAEAAARHTGFKPDG
jgi:hypothetical protein